MLRIESMQLTPEDRAVNVGPVEMPPAVVESSPVESEMGPHKNSHKDLIRPFL